MAVLRITGPSVLELLFLRRSAVAMGGAEGKTTPSALETYTNNLTKLIPGEALSLYALGGSVSVPDWVQEAHLQIWPAVCLLIAIFFRLLATKTRGFWPQFWAVGVSAISFVLWVYAEDNWILSWQINKDYTFLMRYFVILWTFLIPLLVSEKKQNNPTASAQQNVA